MSSDNKVTMTRVIFGVASVGATLALVYLYNRFHDRKRNTSSGSSSGGASSTTGSRIRRQSAKSGEVKKVTFKTSEDDDDGERERAKSVLNEAAGNNDSKSLSHELQKQKLLPSVLKTPPVVASHDATKGTIEKSRKGDDGTTLPMMVETNSSSPLLSSSSSTTARNKSARDDELSSHDSTPTNSYECNSTLKLEDSCAINTSTTTNNTAPTVVATPAVEEVIARSKSGPLMTSTPLPSKDSAVSKRSPGVAVFEPHSSDLQSSPAVQQVDGAGRSVVTPADADYDAHQLRKEMRIPREIVPGLIGKRGCNIKGIQAQSGTTITFQDETLENGDRICVIRGAPSNVTFGESLIEKFIMDQPTIYTETLTVPLSSVGRIIGKGGETIRSIQDLSKARVNVESHKHYGNDAGPTRTITIKGSEEQISVAKKLICEKVEEERNLRKTINDATASRTHRRGGNTSPPHANAPSGGLGGTGNNSVPVSSAEPVLPLKQDGILEVFVSCVYHPNDFWIQVVGRDAIELDKLCETMTDYYSTYQKDDASDSQFNVGDIVAAPFEVDGKM